MRRRRNTIRRPTAGALTAALVPLSLFSLLTIAAPLAAQRTPAPHPDSDRAPAARRAVPRSQSTAPAPAPRPRPRVQRSHRGGRTHGHYGGYGYYGGYPGPARYWSRHYYGWGLGGFFPYYWDGWGYGPRVVVRPGVGPAVGGLDLNVRPKKTQVYVDGVLVGRSGQYDGFPSYLWLESGVHEIVFYRPGFQTVARRVTVPRGGVIDVDLRLEEGEAVAPEELMAEREPPAWRRLPPDRDRSAAPAATEPVGSAESRAEGADALDLRAEPGVFRLAVEPADSSVYLNGRFLGTGSDLARLHAGLLVDAGAHELEVVRPGYRSRSERITVEEGAEVELEVVLEPAAGQ